MPPPPIPAKALRLALDLQFLIVRCVAYSCHNELVHVPSQATEEASKTKDRIGEQEASLPSKDITQLSV